MAALARRQGLVVESRHALRDQHLPLGTIPGRLIGRNMCFGWAHQFHCEQG